MINARPAHRATQVMVVRRNLSLRLAGAGYAVVTGAWLTATLGQAGPKPLSGEILFGLLTLIGLVFALLRNDLILDGKAGTVRSIRGLPGFARQVVFDLAGFDRLVVQEERVQDYEEGAIQPVRRAEFSVALVGADGARLPLLSVLSDESEEARSRGRQRAIRKAQSISAAIGLPVQED